MTNGKKALRLPALTFTSTLILLGVLSTWTVWKKINRLRFKAIKWQFSRFQVYSSSILQQTLLFVGNELCYKQENWRDIWILNFNCKFNTSVLMAVKEVVRGCGTQPPWWFQRRKEHFMIDYLVSSLINVWGVVEHTSSHCYYRV